MSKYDIDGFKSSAKIWGFVFAVCLLTFIFSMPYACELINRKSFEYDMKETYGQDTKVEWMHGCVFTTTPDGKVISEYWREYLE